MLQFPGFNKIAFEIGPFFGVGRSGFTGTASCTCVGFAAGWWLGRRRAAQPGSTWKPNDVDDLVFYAMLGGILGGRIGYVLFYGLPFWAQGRVVSAAHLGRRHVHPRRPARRHRGAA